MRGGGCSGGDAPLCVRAWGSSPPARGVRPRGRVKRYPPPYIKSMGPPNLQNFENARDLSIPI
jgi:hypothetical protein